MPDLIEDGTVNENDFYGAISPTAIALYDGYLFDILNPDTWMFDVDIIAQSLSNQCRYLGHCRFYSISEHSVRVSRMAAKWGHSMLIQYLALHHDDGEAYIGDIPSPHKSIMTLGGEPVRDLEGSIEYAYFQTLGVLTPTFEEDWKIVKEADLAVYKEERQERPNIGRGLMPAAAKREYLDWHQSMAHFFTHAG